MCIQTCIFLHTNKVATRGHKEVRYWVRVYWLGCFYFPNCCTWFGRWASEYESVSASISAIGTFCGNSNIPLPTSSNMDGDDEIFEDPYNVVVWSVIAACWHLTNWHCNVFNFNGGFDYNTTYDAMWYFEVNYCCKYVYIFYFYMDEPKANQTPNFFYWTCKSYPQTRTWINTKYGNLASSLARWELKASKLVFCRSISHFVVFPSS